MKLSAGARFGPYEIVAEIGAGGMGVVFRATDIKLKRDVAIKVLPESLASDQERLTRFRREAELLASLNHSNIAQIYGLEEGDGTTALVMELVEGPTLEDRIRQGALPADEALGIAMQIAEALEGAHGQGIVHRDLKPANIKLRPDGTVKVLDFGIAKALEPDVLTSEPESPMLTTPATQVGVILGTAAYMSPEQARGKQVDQRADIWAFGCVLYEMLTGQPAFAGEDVPMTLARVLANDTDMDSLPAAISPAARRTIQLCLQKDLAKRVADIRDVKLALGGAFDTGAAHSDEHGPAEQRARLRPLSTAAALIAGGLLVSVVWWSFWPDPAPRPVNRFAYSIPTDQQLRNLGWNVMAFSPTGRHFVYNTSAGLYLRALGELEARLIPGTEESLADPFFSPDGQSVGYAVAGGGLKRIGIGGGAPVIISDRGSGFYGASWGPDDTILFSQNGGIFSVSANGGTPEPVIEAQNGERFSTPEFLPDGDTVLFTARASVPSWDVAQIVAESLTTGERTVLIQGGSHGRYVPSGHLVYAFGDGLFARAFDPETLTVSGGAVPLVQNVARANTSGAGNYSVSTDGTLAYVSGNLQTNRTLVWIDREGREEVVNTPPRTYMYAQLSPDGTQVALDVRDEENDIWIFDLERETLQRLTFDPGFNRAPVWSPDGRVAFSRQLDQSEEVYLQAADGFGASEQLTENSPDAVVPNDFTPDGRMLYMTASFPRDIWIASVDGQPAEGTPLIATGTDESNATLSPDGRWLAYQSSESGQYEIYVRPYPDVDTGRRQISTSGGSHPLWSRDGSELFYLDLEGDSTVGAVGALMAVSIEADAGFNAGTPEMLFENSFLGTGNFRSPYDVSRDGRFLMIQNTAPRDGTRFGATEIVIVENWLEELERLVPTD